jgi:hypothetical protein
MTTYPTKYSSLNDLTKKEIKEKMNTFPWTTPISTLSSVDWCGQKVSKQDFGSNIKFCPLCDQPMIVRIQLLPCEHVLCYSCTKPDSESCYV